MLEVKSLSRDSKDFYRLMGPVFGSRGIAREVGIHIYDDADKEWIVAFDDLIFAGFASIRGSLITDCYVRPEFRNAGVFTEILKRVMLDPKASSANCTAASLPAFLNAGFKIVSETKNFTKVARYA